MTVAKGRPQRTSAKFDRFLTPSPMSTYFGLLQVKLTVASDPSPSGVDVLYGWPLIQCSGEADDCLSDNLFCIILQAFENQT